MACISLDYMKHVMEEQKKFQKKSLNSDDYKRTEKGAKAAKRLEKTTGEKPVTQKMFRVV